MKSSLPSLSGVLLSLACLASLPVLAAQQEEETTKETQGASPDQTEESAEAPAEQAPAEEAPAAEDDAAEQAPADQVPAEQAPAEEAAPAAPPPPKPSFEVNTQADLNTWWHATNQLWMGDTAYRVDGTHFEDGVCSLDLHEGIFMPVYSGKKPVAERQVGVVFVGKGTMQVEFPESGDALRFANHMVTREVMEASAVEAIAHQGAPFEATVTRGMILSADPQVQRLLYDLEPVGGGFRYSESDEAGVDAEYMVSDTRGRLKARAVATNLLPDRRNELADAGLDPVAMLRQDRLAHEAMGFPGEQLRLVADFRTEQSFRVAAQQGRTIGDSYDSWLTCFRDGLGQADTGFRSMVFSQGEDNEGYRHIMRFSGQSFEQAEGDSAPLPPVRMEPVQAQSEVDARPPNFFSNVQRVKVSTDFSLRAHGAALRHVVMALPADLAVRGSWELQKLTLADGRELPWVALRADLPHAGGRDRRVSDLSEAGVDSSQDSSSAAAATGPTGDIPQAEEMDTQSLGLTQEAERLQPTRLISQTPIRYEILALLPEPVLPGEQVDLHLSWKAEWQYANWSWDGRPMGPTTGPQRILPEIMPALGGNAWDFSTRVSVPGFSLRTFSVAASGDTVEKWEDVDGSGRKYVVAQGKNARDVAVSIGQWKEHDDPPAAEMPGVRVHLFFSKAGALPMFPPEVRRVVSFLNRFLPDFPQQEVEVYQGASVFAQDALVDGFRQTAHGLAGVTTIKSHVTGGNAIEVGQTSAVQEEDEHLAQTMIARQVAHQYWGQLLAPASDRDRWIEQGLSDAYAAYYLRAAIGKDAFDKRIDAIRESLEDPVERQATYKRVNRARRFLTLADATSSSDLSPKLRADYGLYFMTHMLRRRLGDEPYFFALDRLAQNRQGERITTEQFQHTMERASGQDLDDYFQYWVHGGFVPEVTLQVRIDESPEGNTIHGCLLTDIPFGKVEIPVRVYEPKGYRVVAGPVDVVDGKGSFTIPNWQGEPEIELDPEKLILAYKRKIKKVKEATACEE